MDWFYINLEYKTDSADDSIVVRKFNLMNTTKNEEYAPQRDANNLLRFKIPSNERCGYWQLIRINTKSAGNYRERALTLPLLWEKGDSVDIYLSESKYIRQLLGAIQFRGRGAFKYEVSQDINDLNKLNGLPNNHKPLPAWFNEHFEYIKPTDSLLKMKLNLLEACRPGLSFLSYNIMKADILCSYEPNPEIFIKKFYDERILLLPDEEKKSMVGNYFATFGNRSFPGINSDGLENSLYSISYLNRKYDADAYVFSGKPDHIKAYNFIKANTTGFLRERTLTYYFLSRRTAKKADSLVKDSKGVFTSAKGRAAYESIARQHQPKQKFKNYTLLNRQGHNVDLDSFYGKILILDFWFTGCSGCQHYYSSVLSKVEDHFRYDPDVKFISISADRQQALWDKGVKSGKYTDEKVVNLNTRGFEHAIIKDNFIVAFPTAIAIDKTGTIKYFNTDNLYSVETLIETINQMKKR